MNDPIKTSIRRDSSSTMTRRSAFRLFAGAGLALATVAVAGPAALANHTSQLYTVSANANFRTGPGTSHAILGVVRPGNTFMLNGQTQNGYAGITYGGKGGWVIASLVVAASSPAPTPGFTGQRKAATSVNLRSGPSTGHTVLRVVPTGGIVQSSDTVKNGFRYAAYQGQAGWIYDAYLALPGHTPSGPTGPVYDPNVATATANLNLRAEPSLSAKVLLVIPSGARVRMEGNGSGQFSKVLYNGKLGWAATAYLN